MKDNELVELKCGKKIYHSRSIAVTGMIIKKDIYDNIYILANKRGIGAADNHGKWNMPCGYIGWDETTEEAVSREVFEETGYDIPANLFKLFGVNSNPSENHQNVTLRYVVEANKTEDLYFMDIDVNIHNLKGGELNEVEEIDWIKLDDVDNYDWAFNHDKIIKEYFMYR